ncbi:hypothetical protein IJ670_04690 [bacterium]|nr:hypothetical protein [bacterium]
MSQKNQTYKRWYDHDPLLLKVINLLKDYREDLHEQAEAFLKSVEEKVSKEAIENFYKLVKPIDGGKRWYDEDPVISRTVELLRVVPIQVQKDVSRMFIEALKDNGINVD